MTQHPNDKAYTMGYKDGVKAERERILNLPDLKSLQELASPNAEFLPDCSRVTQFCIVANQFIRSLTQEDKIK